MARGCGKPSSGRFAATFSRKREKGLSTRSATTATAQRLMEMRPLSRLRETVGVRVSLSASMKA